MRETAGPRVIHSDGRVIEPVAEGNGVIIDPATAGSLDSIDGLGDAQVIVIRFAKYTDGRGYSFARQLREEHGFAGELRASGDVLLDQIPLMARCGFDSFEVTDPATIAALEAGQFAGIRQTYQSPRLRRAPGGGAWSGRERDPRSKEVPA